MRHVIGHVAVIVFLFVTVAVTVGGLSTLAVALLQAIAR